MSGVRRQLTGLVAVTTSLVLLAFLVPLAIVLRHNATDRGIAAATDAAQSAAALVAVQPNTAAGVNGQIADGLTVSVFMGDGTVYGAPGTRTPSVELAAAAARSPRHRVGVEVLVPVQGMPGGTAVVRAYAAPDLLDRGVTRTWVILAGLGLALFALGLILADRLGRRLTSAVTALAATADRLAAGDLDARVKPDGPSEIRRVGGEELNRLAGRIGELLTAEREEVADLAHRLRTPVTALRLDVDSIRSSADRARVDADVDDLNRVVDEVIRTARRPVREGAGATPIWSRSPPSGSRSGRRWPRTPAGI